LFQVFDDSPGHIYHQTAEDAGIVALTELEIVVLITNKKEEGGYERP
jgi:hypothetical protein